MEAFVSPTSYVDELPRELLAAAHCAEFIDEPIWEKPEALKVLLALRNRRFAVTNIYVYALQQSGPSIPAQAVFDLEIDEFPYQWSWRKILNFSTRKALRWVRDTAFPPVGALSTLPPAFSFAAFDEVSYRNFLLASRDLA